MAFTDIEIAEHTLTLEKHFWAHRRPPLHLREEIREGQRFLDQSIELFFVRPAFNHPDQQISLATLLETGRWQVAPLPAPPGDQVLGRRPRHHTRRSQRLFLRLTLRRVVFTTIIFRFI